jgi:hypothetical protein
LTTLVVFHSAATLRSVAAGSPSAFLRRLRRVSARSWAMPGSLVVRAIARLTPKTESNPTVVRSGSGMDTVVSRPPVTPSVRPTQEVWSRSANRPAMAGGAASTIGENARGAPAVAYAAPAGPIRSQALLDGIQTSGRRSAPAVIDGSSATTSTGLHPPCGGPIVCAASSTTGAISGAATTRSDGLGHFAVDGAGGGWPATGSRVYIHQVVPPATAISSRTMIPASTNRPTLFSGDR